MNCHACSASVPAAAKFCPKCGAQIGTAQAAGWRAGLPWGVAGLALGALLAVIALRAAGGRAPSGPDSNLGAATPGAGAIDISRMSPEERAARLYNRVMSLHSRGQIDSAEFFLPMALQAYAMLPTLGLDERYHLGVLGLTGNNPSSALAQADTIQRAMASHLFGFMLRAHALELRRDTAAARRAYRDFLKNEASERARRRPEYDEHARSLDAFHEQAIKVPRGRTPGEPRPR